jgi:hypothetical protein
MNPTFPLGSDAMLLRIVFGATLLWLLAAAASAVASRSAAWRHRVWSLATLAALLLPAAALLLPKVRCGLIPPPTSVQEEPASTAHFPSQDSNFQANTELHPATAETLAPPMAADNAGESLPPPGGESYQRSADLSLPSTTTDLAQRTGSPRSWRWLWLAVFATPATWQFFMLLRALAIARGLVARSQSITDDRALGQLRRWANDLGWSGAIGLRESSETAVPLCCGLWRPTVLLPRDWRAWSDEWLHAALGHEVAHIVRRDVAWQLLVRVACGLYWFHPLAWIAAWRMRVERELACDDVVLAAGQPPAAYARVLVELAGRLLTREAKAGADLALPMAAPSWLEQRVRAALAKEVSRLPVSRAARWALGLFAAAGVIVAGSFSPFSSVVVAPAPALADEPLPRDTQPAPAIHPDYMQLRGQVVDAEDRPVADFPVTQVNSSARPHTRTDADGNFTLTIPRSNRESVQLLAGDAGAWRQGWFSRWREERRDLPEPKIKLQKTRAVLLKVIDAEGRPVKLARVGVGVRYATLNEQISGEEGESTLLVPAGLPLYYVYAYKEDLGLDYFHFNAPDELRRAERIDQHHAERIVLKLAGAHVVRVRAVDEHDKPLPGVLVYPTAIDLPRKAGALNATLPPKLTGDDGTAEFREMPAHVRQGWHFRGERFGYQQQEYATLKVGDPGDVATLRMRAQVLVSGSVKHGDGTPAAGAVVRIDERNSSAETICNEEGKFEKYVGLDRHCRFVAQLGGEISAEATAFIRPPHEMKPIELKLSPGARVFGTLRDPKGKLPVAGEFVSLAFLPREDDDGRDLPPLSYTAKTNDAGQYELLVGPGKYRLTGWNVMDALELEVGEGQELKRDLRSKREPPVELKVTVVLASDHSRRIAGAMIDGVRTTRGPQGATFSGVADDDGQFTVDRSPEPMLLLATSPDRKLGGLQMIAADTAEIEIALAPTASARGRLIGRGGPRVDEKVQAVIALGGPGPRDRFSFSGFGASTRTDAKGEFTLNGLVVGGHYLLQHDDEAFDPTFRGLGELKPERAEVIDLGDLAP